MSIGSPPGQTWNTGYTGPLQDFWPQPERWLPGSWKMPWNSSSSAWCCAPIPLWRRFLAAVRGSTPVIGLTGWQMTPSSPPGK
ncbi:MAG TPA: hypothetical protein GX730_09980 [Chloroflexi bacterium]|nr:hypothetical protein [Chloroflexota bacterium]